MLTLTKLNLFDIVALKNDLPQHRLQSGQVGTIVEILAPEVYEIEFSDDDGQTYAIQALHAHQLLKLHYKPMPNNINQYGSGDNIAGDKVTGDKIGTQFNNNLQGANIANFANEVKDNARQQASNFSQTSGASVAELLQIISTLRQTAAQFPPDIREDITIDIDDVEAEIQKPEKERSLPKLKKRLLALLTAATVIATPIAGITDFTNNVLEIGGKLGIELIKK
ncbi:DUF4926 domain-containing protein [Pseudanabaena sp. UWO310]|uniref:DUF4926 domain-containing protein n=1 Tax=Pseudanabaena sp. UWO310 TaxID=2480795 RepID=UPI001CC1E216|nr:DUF4926 domain-containing protein [Pseudanabaena sp. UWO310]